MSLIIKMAIPGLNKDVLDRIVKELGLQSAVERLPVDLNHNIQPVLISNPEKIVNRVIRTDSTGTMYTVPNKTEFYITSLAIGAEIEGALGDKNVQITVKLPTGETVTLAKEFLGNATLASNVSNTFYDYSGAPIRLTTGGTITATKTVDSMSVTITGYERAVL